MVALRTALIVVAFGIIVATTFGGIQRRLRIVRIIGESMAPALHAGDFVVVRRPTKGLPRRGAIAVFLSSSGRLMVKRVVAEAGDLLQGPVTAPVEAGTIFLAGDNRPRIGSRRLYGPVREEDVVGLVLVRVNTSWFAGRQRHLGELGSEPAGATRNMVNSAPLHLNERLLRVEGWGVSRRSDSHPHLDPRHDREPLA